MTDPRHAADDPSPLRSPGGAAVRGTLLILVAVLLGVVLLQANDEPDPFTNAASNGDAAATTTTTVADGEPATGLRAPGEVKTLVANGGGVAGAGKAASDVLVAAGYNVLSAVNTTAPATQPAVLHREGFAGEARLVAGALGIDPALVAPMPEPAPVTDDREFDVLVVLDEDAGNRLKAGAAPAEAGAETG